MSEGFEGKNIVRLDTFRKKREGTKLPIETNPVQEYVPAPEAVKLTIEEVLKIAQDVVEKYDVNDGGTLFNAFLEEQSKESSIQSIEGYHAMLAQKKEMVSGLLCRKHLSTGESAR